MSNDKVSHLFSTKLNMTMTCLSLTNAQLARSICIDAAQISRYRTGARQPNRSRSSHIISDMCRSLSAYAINSGKENSLMSLITDSTEYNNKVSLEENLKNWFTNDTSSIFLESDVKNLFLGLEKFIEPRLNAAININSILSYEDVITNSKTFYRKEGLQECVINFLCRAYYENCRTLYLFSEETIDWLLDPSFKAKWITLMIAVLKNRTRIVIIHNIKRNLHEIVSAVQSWLPMYMSGMIEPFYFNKTGNSHLANTLFIADDSFCISGCQSINGKDTSFYEYQTDPSHVQINHRMFCELQQQALPFVKIFTYHDYCLLRSFLADEFCKALEKEETMIIFSGSHDNTGDNLNLTLQLLYSYTGNTNMHALPSEHNNLELFFISDFVILLKKTSPEIIFIMYNDIIVAGLLEYFTQISG